MADSSNNLQLGIQVSVADANAAILQINEKLSGLEAIAGRSTQVVSRGFDGMTASMAQAVVTGNLFVGALGQIEQAIKQATVDAALYAAKIDQLSLGLKAVAVGNGASLTVVNQQIESMKQMGVTTADATVSLTKLIAAGADYTKTTQLMVVAQNISHATGKDLSEVMEGLVRAVDTGNQRMLRNVGLAVDFVTAQRKMQAASGDASKELGQYGKIQANLNEVLRVGSEFNGVFAKSQGGVAESFRLLKVHVTDAREAIGREFQQDLQRVLELLNGLALFAGSHSAEIAGLARVLKDLAAAVAVLVAAKGIAKVIEWLPKLAAFAAVNPWVGAIAGAAALIVSMNDLLDLWDKWERKTSASHAGPNNVLGNPNAPQLGAKNFSGKIAQGELLGYLNQQDATANESARVAREAALKDKAEQAAKDAIEAAKKLAAERQHVEEDAAKTLSEVGKQSWNSYYRDVEAVFQKIEDAIQKHALTTKAKIDYMRALLGTATTSKAPAGTVAFGGIDVSGATLSGHTPGMLEIAQKKEMEGYLKAQQEVLTRQRDLQIKATEEANNYESEVLKSANENIDKQYDYQQQKLDQSHTLQLKALDEVNAQTVKQKLWVEQQKFAIEQEYLKKSEQLQLDRLSLNALQQRTEAIGTAQDLITKGANPDQVNATLNQQLGGINDQLELAQKGVQSKISTQQQEAADTAVKAQTKVYQDQYKSVYDAILKQTDSFFDAITNKSKNAWKAITDDMKNMFTKAIKAMVEAPFARWLTNLVTGMNGNGEGFGKQGGLIMGSPGGMGSGLALAGGGLAAMTGYGNGGGFVGGGPSFGGAGGGSSSPLGFLSRLFGGRSSGGGSFGGPTGSFPVPDMGAAGVMSDIARGGGGIPGYAGSGVGYGSGGGFTGASGSNPLSSIGGLGSIFKGGGSFGNFSNALGSLLPLIGAGMLMKGAFNPQLAGTASGTINTVGGAAGLGYGIGNMVAPGFGPMGAVAGLGIGGLINGSERGSGTGVIESTAGGALGGAEIGAMIGMMGGPIGMGLGAVIGAGVGLISGLIGMFVGNAVDKVKKDVKQAYGITIDTNTAQAILKIAQQQFGGSIPLAISSASVRQMLSMYALATSQQSKAMAISPQKTPYTVADSGGGLTSIPSTYDGISVASQLGGVLPQGNPNTMSTGGLGVASGAIHLQLNGPATTQLLQGQIVSAAPAAVQNANSSTMNGNAAAARLFSPGLIVR